MKKNIKFILLFIVSLFTLLMNTNNVYAANCDTKTAEQLAKIVYHEAGEDSAKNKEDNFFQRLNTASIVLNNANNKSGNTMYEKIMNLTKDNYATYNEYKNNSFSSEVVQEKQGEMLYIAELVLTGKYNLPKNMTLQASKSIVTSYGTIWTYVENPGRYDIYFGYEGKSLSNTNVFGETLYNTSVSYYRSLAKSYEKSSYNITSSTVCKGNANSSPNSSNSGSSSSSSSTTKNDSTIEDACTNPDILRVIYFGKLIVDIVKIIIPIGLIIIGMVDFSKSVVTSDDGTQKKNMKLFVKRIVFAVLVFAVPWIVEVLMINLGNLTDGVNFTDCLENANSEKIEALEKKTEEQGNTSNEWACYYCPSSDKYLWRVGIPSENCPGGIGWSKKTDIKQKDCELSDNQADETQNNQADETQNNQGGKHESSSGKTHGGRGF